MIKDLKALAESLESAVQSFTDVAIIGVSGGVDSATVASVCVAALGKENVYLVSMPYNGTDLETFNSRSGELADFLQANHFVVPIASAVDGLNSELSKVFSDKELHRLTSGNSRARVRMAVLYGISGELSLSGALGAQRVRVMGTGNASEDLIGYDTKGGDALADLFVIGDLFKSEVYQLARYYQVPESILNAVPSAGLYEGQTDEQELGYTYDDLEPALAALHECISRGVKDQELSAALPEFADVSNELAKFVVGRFLAHAHKHRAPKVVQVRQCDFMGGQ